MRRHCLINVMAWPSSSSTGPSNAPISPSVPAAPTPNSALPVPIEGCRQKADSRLARPAHAEAAQAAAVQEEERHGRQGDEEQAGV